MAKNQSTGGLWSPIHALTVLAEAGSFTAAAQRLNLSKAAMSQRVAELEAAAGVPLVQRTTRSMQLTDAGRQLVSATQQAFATIDQAFAEVRDLADAPSGRLRVTAPVALARQCIVPLLPGFLQAYPSLQVELDLSDRLRPLAQEGFDLAIRHTSTPPDTHVAWKLRETRSVLLASPDYLARRPAPRVPQDLREHECLYYPRPGDTAACQRPTDRPLRGQQQRGVARGGTGRARHHPAAGFQRRAGAGRRPAGRVAAHLARRGRLRHAPVGDPALRSAGAAWGAGVGGLAGAGAGWPRAGLSLQGVVSPKNGIGRFECCKSHEPTQV
jgi:DNA-binding transcriptional LysR family regulator